MVSTFKTDFFDLKHFQSFFYHYTRAVLFETINAFQRCYHVTRVETGFFNCEIILFSSFIVQNGTVRIRIKYKLSAL